MFVCLFLLTESIRKIIDKSSIKFICSIKLDTKNGKTEDRILVSRLPSSVCADLNWSRAALPHHIYTMYVLCLWSPVLLDLCQSADSYTSIIAALRSLPARASASILRSDANCIRAGVPHQRALLAAWQDKYWICSVCGSAYGSPLCLWGTKWKQWGCLAAFDSGVLSSENMGHRRKSLLERGEAEPAIQIKSGAAILLHRGPELGPGRGWMSPFCEMQSSSALQGEVEGCSMAHTAQRRFTVGAAVQSEPFPSCLSGTPVASSFLPWANELLRLGGSKLHSVDALMNHFVARMGS